MIDSKTDLYAVFGDPVGHSLSPLMHNRAFYETRTAGVYLAFRVQDIAAGIAAARTLGIKGISVTIPHKTAVMDSLDEIDENARAIGAVNTVVNSDGRLSGHNTDSAGAVRALKDISMIKGMDVAVIGAGGAARAIGYGLKSEGARVTILNRTKSNGERLAAELGADFQPLTGTRRLNCRILINTTPVGMTPRVEALPVGKDLIAKEMLIMDIVYNPLKTQLLKIAEDIGCRTIDGVSMFVYQGAYQFELWTGKAAPVEAMRDTVVQALSKTLPAQSETTDD